MYQRRRYVCRCRNFLKKKHERFRIDRKEYGYQQQSPYLQAVDILRARQERILLIPYKNHVNQQDK
ncbi:TPA: TA system toxin CbtA family protein [Salmonella enterica subsp. enterica]